MGGRRIDLDGIGQDLRLAFRAFRRAPGYALVVVLTLGLGIGVNTAIFSVIHGVLLKPLANAGGERLVVLHHHTPLGGGGSDDLAYSVLDLESWREGLGTVDALVEVHQMSFNLLGEGEPEEVLTGVVDHAFFSVMGVEPILGRGFTEEEDRVGGDAVMVLSYPYWESRFGRDPSVLGRTFVMNDRVHTVVGVLPDVPQYPRANDIYVPTSQCPIRSDAGFRENRNARMMQAFARMGPGATVEDVRRESSLLATRLSAAFPGSYPADRGYSAGATPLQEELIANSRTILLVLLGTAGLVLLVACANVANLSLARLSRREPEFAVRRALGAGEGRLARQLLTESLVLSGAGALLGLVLAWWGLDVLVGYAARFTPRAAEAALSLPVMLFAVAAAVITGLVFGSAPVLAGRRSASGALREAAGATGSRRKMRVQNGLVMAQVALAFVLLGGAGLLIRSFALLQDVDGGFSTANVVTMRVAFPVGGPYGDAERQTLFWEGVLARVQEDPAVLSAAVANLAPLTGGGGTVAFRIEGGAGGAEPIRAQSRTVSPGYFETAGIPLLMGDGFPAGIRGDDERVVVVNRAFARAHFGNESPVGTRLVPCSAAGDCSGEGGARIVGVVGDVRQSGLEVEPSGEVYVAGVQQGFWGNRILVRTRTEPMGVVRGVTAAVHAHDPALPVVDVQTLESLRTESLAPRRLTTILLTGFAGLALAVTLAGIAGVTAFTVAQRSREIGIRMALGADRGQVLRLVLRDGVVMVGAGLTLGIVAAWLLSGTLRSLVWGIATTDPLTYGAVAALLLLVALVACWIPARRATRIDPVRAFRGGMIAALLMAGGAQGGAAQVGENARSRPEVIREGRGVDSPWESSPTAGERGAERWIPGPELEAGFGPALSPDGLTLLYVVRRRPETIVVSHWVEGRWTAPEPASFSGEWADQEPFVSPDGARVVFASRRPTEPEGGDPPGSNLWVVERQDDGTFGEPSLLGPQVNTTADEGYPTVTADGTLYFSRMIPGRGTDLFRALPDGDGFLPAEPVEALNSGASDADPWIDPGGRRMVFSTIRDGGAGQGDLYVSYLCREGWTTPWNLGPLVNTEAYEYTPLITPDGQWLLFTRDRWDVFRIRTSELDLETPCPDVGSGGDQEHPVARDRSSMLP